MRNTVIDNLRGICMLGVVAIHIGSLALTPNNFWLYAVLEVLSRYSVPTFFFISGYGLFCQIDKPVSYLEFMKKRLSSVGVPYLSWSLLYMLYFWLILPPGYVSWQPLHVAFTLFFGLGCYHLYFMVILLWFYASFPLWRNLLCAVKSRVWPGLAALFIFQLAFNYWTTHPGIDVSAWPVVAKNFFSYRLNYLPLHYLLIFISGGLVAVYLKQFTAWISSHFKLITIIYIAAVAYDLGSAYHAFYYKGYSLLDLANTYHQLSPQGLVYTLASIVFFCAVLQRMCQSTLQYKALKTFSDNSLIVYLIHPLLLDWLSSFYNHFGIIMTVKKVALSYFIILAGSLLASIVLTKALQYSKTARFLLTGKIVKK